MRYLILSDIHSNLEAFQKCMEMADAKYDQALCLGDLVGYGPDPNAVIEGVRQASHIIIRGNHDKACAGITDAHDFNRFARLATLWTREQLNVENLSFLLRLPSGPVALNGFQLVHGSPSDEDEYLFGRESALPALRSLSLQVVFFGHTHLQGGFLLTFKGGFARVQGSDAEDGCALVLPLQDGTRYLINPGSVGQPRDGDWRAAFALYDTEAQVVYFHRTPYNLKEAQDRIFAAKLPARLATRLAAGR